MKVLCFLMVFTLAGCGAIKTSTSQHVAGNNTCPSKLTADQELKLSMISQQVADGKQYAALAGLAELPDASPKVIQKKADLLRRIGSSEARSTYERLQKTCLSAYGDHGLGLLYASERNFEKALMLMERAAAKVPTDDAIRNDLGLTYLYRGNVEKARFELMTAVELNDAQTRAVTNLAALFILTGDSSALNALNERFKINIDQISQSMELCSQVKSHQLASADLATSERIPELLNPEPQCSWGAISNVPRLAALFRTHQ